MKLKSGWMILFCLVVLLVAASVWLIFSKGGAPDNSKSVNEKVEVQSEVDSSEKTRKIRQMKMRLRGKEKIKERKRRTWARPNSNTRATKESRVVIESPLDELTDDERKLYDEIQEALDSENIQKVKQLCEKISSSSNKEIRQQAVAALGWFDGKTMAELTPFLADPDADIASDALFQWQEALTQIQSETDRVRIVIKAMDALTDENALDQISMELNSVDEKLAIEALKQIINSSNPTCADKGKEAYEFITGEKYTNPAAADKWLKENYTPPEA